MGYKPGFTGHFQHGRILDNECIHAGFCQVIYQSLRFRQFFLIYYGIHRCVNTDAKAVGIFTQPGYIFHRVSGGLPGPEGGSCNIYGIGPAVYGRDANFRRPGGR